MIEKVQFTLNGKPVEVMTDSERKLLWILRTDLSLTGSKYGCGIGLCGSCTVLIDGKSTCSCITPLKTVKGKKVMTIEGLAFNGKLHPLQKAFIKYGGFQCGYCTSGMIMGAYSLLQDNPNPSYSEIRNGMEPHLCRCGAYKGIIEAIQTASKEMRGK